MEEVLTNSSVVRVSALLKKLNCSGQVRILSESARTALDAADSLGIEVGQVASSIVFRLPSGNPLLVITSGRHRVDTSLVAENLGVEKLHRADAEFIKESSGFSIGGVAPIGWLCAPEITVIDRALDEYEIVWAASGHPHAVYPTTYAELIRCSGATPMVVGA
ncbi:MAG: YbaK/EbsC family protein [Candidatus Planktophila sp.]|nr:YbaK/EbsC family protein [Candidatus Planktophila sp.]